jgi:hypothetical protein
MGRRPRAAQEDRLARRDCLATKPQIALAQMQAAVNVRNRPAHRDPLVTTVRSDEWLLIEWPDGEGDPAS